MRIIKPINITDTNLLGSNVPEDDYAAWNATDSYLVGDRRLRNHRIYEALIAHTGVDPAGPATDPATWLDLGATNRWRMFDERVSSQTTAAGEIAITLQPGEVVNAIGLINCRGVAASITVTDPTEGVVYQRTVPLVDAGAESWYAYFFAPYDYISDLVLTDLPAYPAATVDIVIASDTTAAIGQLALGKQRELGVALYGTSVGITDYSRKEIDSFGNTEVVKRAFSKRAEFDISLDTSKVSLVQRVLADIRAQPVVWIGEESYEAAILFGFYKDFSIIISGPSASDATITVESII